MISARKVRIFDLTFDDDFRAKFNQGCQVIFNEGHLSNHTFVRKFEDDFRAYNRSKFSLAINNGTSSLEVALRALNVRGKRVLVQSNTFIATAVAIKNAGGIPDLVDIENKYFGLCPEALKSKIDSDVAAVIVVHIGGLVTPYIHEVAEICRDAEIGLLEDAAQAQGSSYRGVEAGNFGLIGAFSFFTTKIMTTGEGGMLVTSDNEVFEKMHSLRQFGVESSDGRMHSGDGANYKMNEFSALVGVLELERINERIAQRQLLAKRYQDNLKGSHFKTLQAPANGVCNNYKQIVLLASDMDREIVRLKMQEKGVTLTGGVYEVPLHRQPMFANMFDGSDFTVSNYFAEKHICPPCYPELSLEDVDYVCEILLSI